MIRKRLWPRLLLPLALPAAGAALLALALILILPTDTAVRSPDALRAMAKIDPTVTWGAPEAKAVVAADPFAGDRKEPPRRARSGGPGRPAAIGGRPAARTGARLALLGVIAMPDGPIAMLRDATSGETVLLRPGEQFRGYRLDHAGATEAELTDPGGRRIRLSIGFEESTGGKHSPGARAAAGPAAAGGPRPALAPGTHQVRIQRPIPAGAAQPARRGPPRPAARFRERERDVQVWQRKLEDYGVAGGRPKLPRPEEESGDGPPGEPQDERPSS